MALPPIDANEDLEAEDTELSGFDEGMDDEGALEPIEDAPDPMFAADVAEAFPELEDAQIMALQRAMLGLITMGGSGAPPAPAAPLPPMGM